MASKFSIVQYLPDPLIGERINIGVIVFGESQILSQFLDDWSRVECFAGNASIQFLKEFAERVQDTDPEQLGFMPADGFSTLTEEGFERLARSWSNAVQFTPLRASLLDAHALLASIAPRFLRLPQGRVLPVTALPRRRTTAARIAVEGLGVAIRRTGVHAELRRKALLPGKVEQHRFDAVAENGAPFIAMHGLSFELADDGEVIRNVDALGFAIQDVKSSRPDLRLGVVALRRKQHEEREPFLRALHIFGAFGARVLQETEARLWAEETIRGYAAEHGVELGEPQPV
jgi:hypothetical protein